MKNNSTAKTLEFKNETRVEFFSIMADWKSSPAKFPND
jgi:hypothetical protein